MRASVGPYGAGWTIRPIMCVTIGATFDYACGSADGHAFSGFSRLVLSCCASAQHLRRRCLEYGLLAASLRSESIW